MSWYIHSAPSRRQELGESVREDPQEASHPVLASHEGLALFQS